MTESYRLSKQDKVITNLDKNQAIEVIMNRYGNEIRRLIFTYVKNKADTDDVAQEVFVTVYKNLHTFQKRSSLKSWIYSISVNKSKDHLRSWKMRNQRLKERSSEMKSGILCLRKVEIGRAHV